MNIYNFHWREIYAILVILNRQRELSRLIAWASRKHLRGPRRSYQLRLDDTERTLFRHQVSAPRLTAIARLLLNFNRLIFPTPRYFPKGSASAYRYNSLTKQTKSHSMWFRLT